MYELFINFIIALCGGFLMNFMPCILPLISVKVSGFLKNSHSKSDFIFSNIAYSAGIFIFFATLGIFIAVSKTVSNSIMLVSHMQSSIFLLVIFFILLLMAMSLSGFFEFNLGSGSSFISRISGLFSSKMSYVLNGFFVSILSISCTAPFIVTALAYALKSNLNLAITMFAISLGFSAPFLLSAIFSNRVLNFLPRPGPWMEKFKNLMSFPIYGATLWILYVLMRHENHLYFAIAISFGFALFFSLWFIKNIEISKYKKIVVCALIFAFSYFVLPIDHDSEIREDFSYEKFDNILKNHERAMVVASASWCITCYVNEKNALQSKGFLDLLRKKNVRYLYIDLTNENMEGENFLERYNHSGVPFYIVFDSNGGYEILQQILTESLVIEKIRELL